MKLSKLIIEYFRGIENVEITFNEKMNFIVGDNNVGKTRVIEAVNAFYNKDKESKMTMIYNLDDLDIEKLKQNKNFSNLKEENIKIELNEGKHIYEGRDLKSSISKDNLLGQVIYVPAVISHTDEQNIGKASSHINTAFIKLISKNETLEKRLNELNSQFSDYVDSLKKETEEMYKEINQNIAFNNIEASLGKKDIKNDQIIKNNLELKLIENGIEKEFWELGTGIQRNVINAILSIQEDDEFIIYLYDEPETYLNITAQRKLINSFMKNTNKCQYIVATHSPAIIKRDKDTFNRIIKLKKIENNNIKVLQFDEEKYKNYIKEINDYLKSNGIMDGKLLEENPNNSILAWWDSNRVNALFENKIILIEGATEEILLDLMIDEEMPYVNSIGKFKMPYFIILFNKIFDIEVICMFDSDGDKNELHKGFNEWIKNNCLKTIICEKCLEEELGYEEPPKNKEQEIIDRYLKNEILEDRLSKIVQKIINRFNS